MTLSPHVEPAEIGPGLLESLWRFRRMVVLTVVIAALVGYGLSLLLPTQYEARAELILTDPSSSSAFQDTNAGRDLSRYVRNEAAYITSTEVLSRAAETLPDVNVDGLRQSITAVASNDIDLITITALRPTAEQAVAAADAVAVAYQDLKGESVRTSAENAIAELRASGQELQSEVDILEAAIEDDPDNSALRAQRDAAVAQLVTLESRISQIDINAALFGTGVSNYEHPEMPESPASPKPLRNAAATAILGLLAVGAYAWWRTENSPLADNPHDPAPVLGAPLLGEVPDFEVSGSDGELPAAAAPHSVAAERYHFIVSALDFALAESGASAVLVTSAAAGDGKTVTTVNLAAAATTDGRKVRVVDGDERRRRITRLAGENQHLGLVDMARNDVAMEDCLVDWHFADGFSVELLPAGTDSEGAAAFFRSPEFRKAMTRVKSGADLVIIDSPPVLAVSETADIASEVDGVVLVVKQGTPLAALEDVRSRIAMTNTRILGYVFNQSTPPRFGYSRYANYYSAAYGYGQGYQVSDRRGRRRRN